MNQTDAPIWHLFASVKLALVLIGLLAATSIIGTIIPQGQPPEYYQDAYGPGPARLLQALDLTAMYGSWWFLLLLLVFAVNLVVCSLERLPRAWRLVTRDHLATEPARLEKMPLKAELAVAAATPAAAAEKVANLLAAAGWPSAGREREGGVLLFAQKGAWSRLGAYLVHLSILVIFAGALVGAVFGYKGGIMFPEGVTISRVFEHGSAREIPLGFQLRLDNFAISYYPNGMAREYRSDVTILDPALVAPRQTAIRVNHPLKHRGLTFYQASYEPRPEFLVRIRNQANGRETSLLAGAGQPFAWPEEEVSFQLATSRSDRQGRVEEFQVSFSAPGAEPNVFPLRDLETATLSWPGGDYLFYVRQRYATGLQVARDPGVWVVYAGFALMLLGLYVTFLVTHRRVWACLRPDGEGRTRLLLAGGSNRNQATFDQRFAELVERLRRDPAIK
ncbi:cytochrome c biogenesis protein ResB [Desulfurivibrio sp. C05AmB]|uniref:cytochrome c biogenesis protein ResB n=1 Tax=Desulfurivibrio sp. C05AmB TaxID=3374371 RepID=UPI00376EB1E3